MTIDAQDRSGVEIEELGSSGPDQHSVPLSYGQEQLWFLDQLSPGETTYNILLAWRLFGSSLDPRVLSDCLDLVVARHASLRMVVGVDDGTPYQVETAPAGAGLIMVDLSALPSAEREQEVARALADLTKTPYDLRTGPLYRFLLYRMAPGEHVLCMGFHHLVTDGWSSAVLNAEISAAYPALAAGREPSLDPVTTDYAAYAIDQRERLRGAALEEELSFWQERLAGMPELELPTDRPRPPDGSQQGASVITELSSAAWTAARNLAEQTGYSVFMVLAAAVNVVLRGYAGAEDIGIGVPMLGRPDPDLESVVGLFINMTVLRTDLSGDPSFATVLDRVADGTMELYEHQEIPFNLVVDRIGPIRNPGRNPLFCVAMQLLSGATSGDNLGLPGVSAQYVLLESVMSRFDITMNFIDTGDKCNLSVEYSADLFDRWRIEALAGHIETVLVAAGADPTLALSKLPLLTASEREALLAAGRGETVPYPPDLLHAMTAKAAAATPDAAAVVCRGVELSYAELDRRAGMLARYLRAKGLRAGQVVALVIDRDLDAYVALVGILKAGGAFAVLDPSLPASRVDFMIRDTAAPIVLTRAGLAERLPAEAAWSVVRLDADWERIEAGDADAPLAEWATPESLAYVLYTSGSSGTPKGVMIQHRAVAMFADAYRRTYGFAAHDRLLQLPSLAFDMSQGEIWTAFSVGATVVAVAPEEATSPEALATLMREQRVSYAGLPPAMQSVLDPEPYPDLKFIMGGAEALPPDLVNKWNLPGRTYVNLYGPTEATVACTEYVCEHTTWRRPPPIGRPHVNRQVYVVDKWGDLAPRGVPGELLIGGLDDGLAVGYLNQPELTAEKFPADPFCPGRRVYRSGDLVRWNGDFQLEFLGRLDHQVKLRGLRIELGEIESVLAGHPSVERAVVLMRPDRQGENRLIGYVTPAVGTQPEPAVLREHLSALLPEYMVPTAWVVLAEFPLSSGWKIDRKALPDPAPEAGGDGLYVAPRNATEENIAGIFAEVLGLPRVGALDGFFALGGNSLQAMRTVSRINKKFGIKISIRQLYGSATIAEISVAVTDKLASVRSGDNNG